ncbi:MAG: pyridoxal-dependent decarboxylase [Gemmatimonadota bacterium]
MTIGSTSTPEGWAEGMCADEFRETSARVADWIADYRSRVADFPVTPDVKPGEIAALLPSTAPEQPESMDAILADLEDTILPGLTHWSHPGFMAYFASSASAPGILAEFVAAALNVNAMLWRTSPAATELELRVVDWICNFVGLPDTFSGVILDTASTSTFTALTAARHKAVPAVRERGLAGRAELGPLTVYISEHAHSSQDRAVIAAGIGLDHLRHVPADKDHAVRPDELARLIQADREAGCIPVMVSGTIGTTSSTAVDPCQELAAICEQEDIWFHVDAAYAGPAASLPELRQEFLGWERADSIVLNPHKWMFTPMDCSILVYRNPAAIRAAMALTPEYLASDFEAPDLMDYGLALGRRFRALKLWFIFRHFGAEGLRRRFRYHIGLAQELVSWLETDPRFELVGRARFATVCLTAVPPAGEDPYEWNRRLMAAVNGHREVLLSHTVLDGRYVIRVSIGNESVRKETVRRAYELLCDEHDQMCAKGIEA